MADDGLIKDVKGLTSSLGSLKRMFESLIGMAGKFSGAMSGAMRRNTNFSGGNWMDLGTSGNNTIEGSLANISAIGSMNAAYNRRMSMYSGAAQIGTAVVGGAFSALPDTAATLGYSALNYRASLGSPGYSFGQVGRGTNAMMQGGMTSQGSSAIVAAILSGSGTQYGSDRFGVLTRSVAGAARGLGVENSQAATSFAGMTQAPTANALMNNFGILTNNPITGKASSPTEIYKQLYQRITGGKMTSAEIAESMASGGYVAYNLSQTGLDDTGQQMAYQYMISAASGKPFDLASKTSMTALAKSSGGNPMQGINEINSSNTELMQAASGNYIKAINDMVPAIKTLNTTMEGLSDGLLGYLNASLYGLGQGTASSALVSGIAGAGGATIGMLGAGRAFRGGGGGGGRGGFGGPFLPGGGSGLLPKAIGVLGAVGVGTGAYSAYDNAKKGAAFDPMNLLGSAVSGAAMGAPFGPWGMLAGAVIGTGANLIGSHLGGQGGTSSTIQTAGLTDTTKGISLVAPVRGPITTRYGQKTDVHGNALWGGEQHKAIDYGVPVGTPVQAAATGTIKHVGSGSGDRSYGTYIEIDHGGGYVTLYAHLSSVSVSVGQAVVQGQVIGASGKSGYVTGPHLHFEVRKNGQKVNPASLGLGSAVSIIAGNESSSASSVGSRTGAASGSGPSQVGWGSTGLNTGWAGSVTIPSSYGGSSSRSSRLSTSSMSSSSATNTGMAAMAGRGGSTSGQGGPGLDIGEKGTNVVINVSIEKATAEEAKRLAEMVKTELEKDKLMSSMGRM
jgi:murein DD-endopeptidase MepM/ murein hydrolase activator NlpD